MTDFDEGTLALLKAAAGAHASRHPAHAAPEDLVDYVEGLLPAGRDEEVREHLATCQACARAVLDLTALAQPAEAGTESSAQADQGIERVLAAAGRERQAATETSVHWRSRVLPMAAALVVGTTLGLAGTRFASRPAAFRAAVVAADLAPRLASSSRGPARAERVEVRAGLRQVTLLLTLPVLPPGRLGPFVVEVVDTQERLVWRQSLEGLALARTLLLEVPLKGLGAGPYTVRVRASELPAAEPLAEYFVQLEVR